MTTQNAIESNFIQNYHLFSSQKNYQFKIMTHVEIISDIEFYICIFKNTLHAYKCCLKYTLIYIICFIYNTFIGLKCFMQNALIDKNVLFEVK